MGTVGPALDTVALDIVVGEGVPMPLRGDDRVEAIRQLTHLGLSEIARRLCITDRYVQRIAAANGIRIGRPTDPMAWWYPLSRRGDYHTRATRRRQRATRAAGVTA